MGGPFSQPRTMLQKTGVRIKQEQPTSLQTDIFPWPFLLPPNCLGCTRSHELLATTSLPSTAVDGSLCPSLTEWCVVCGVVGGWADRLRCDAGSHRKWNKVAEDCIAALQLDSELPKV
eukprot:8073338-Pyramimonas_sp.AAC.1